MNVQSYESLLSEMIKYMQANQDKLTDFNEGSIVRTMFEAIARNLESFYIDGRNGYQNNLKAIPYAVFGFTKKSGSKATANVIFSRAEPLNEESSIPIGTQISADGLVFYTTISGKINSGEINSDPISVEAAEIGTEYNVNGGTITTIDSALSSDIISVNNPLRASSGTDDEKDSEMLARFKTYINGLQGTNTYGLKSSILSIPDVRSCSIHENFPAKDFIYNFDVFIDDGTGSITEELKQKVIDVIEGEDTSSNPGCRAAGINCQVSAASPVSVNISLTCKVYRTEEATAMYDIKNAIQEEINSLGINEDVILTSIIMRLRRISYIKDVSNIVLSGAASSGNVEIGDSQIARCGNITLTIVNA